MRTTIKFVLDKPLRKKWYKYISLIPQIDEEMRNLDVVLLKRILEESDYSVEEVFDYKTPEQFTNLVHILTALVERENLSFSLVKSIDEKKPEGYQTTLKVTLRDGYRTNKYWEKLIIKMPDVSEACIFHGVHVNRELDKENYSVRVTAFYNNQSDIAAAFFTAGWIYGNSEIPLEISDIFEKRYSLDLIEDMKEITSKKRSA